RDPFRRRVLRRNSGGGVGELSLFMAQPWRTGFPLLQFEVRPAQVMDLHGPIARLPDHCFSPYGRCRACRVAFPASVFLHDTGGLSMAQVRINDGITGAKTVEAHHFEEKDSFVIFYSTTLSKFEGQVYAVP